MPNNQHDDWAIESARDLRLDLYEPQGLVLEQPPDTKAIQRQAGWTESKLEGDIQSQLITVLQQSLGTHLDLVIADKAGAGKTVTSLRIQNLLSNKQACKQIFADQKTRMAIHWTSFRLPNPGVSNPTLMQMLTADPVLVRTYPDEIQRQRAIKFACEHQRLVVILDGYDELSDDPNSFNRRELIERLYQDPGPLEVSWIFTGRTHAIDDSFRFNRLFQVERFVRFSLCEFDQGTQNRYIAKATQHLPHLKGYNWRDSLEDPSAGWNELLGLPYTLREIARAFEEAAPNIPKWSSPSDLFCQTSRNMLRRELKKPANQQLLRSNNIHDMDEAIEIAERTLGTIALELALQGIRKEVIASSSQEQPKMIRKLVASAKSRFTNSCLADDYEAIDVDRLWKWAYDFIGKFVLHNGSTQAYVTTTSLGFTTQRILEMWAARYITKYASDQDWRDDSQPDRCFLGHNGDEAWKNLWECAIRMPIWSIDKPYGVDVNRYRGAMKLLFERPVKDDQRRPTELMWEAEQWLFQTPNLSGIVAELHQYLAAQFLRLKGSSLTSMQRAIDELLNPENYVLLCYRSSKLEKDTGSFTIGPDPSDRKHRAVPVKLTPFGMAKYTLTRGQMRCWDNGFGGGDDRLAATDISWYDSYYICRFLGGETLTLPDGQKYRFSLPTEAQWEYACRAGCEGEYGFEGSEIDLPQYAWFDGNRSDPSGAQPVGQLLPNRWGLYDMHGNVWEWCWDWYGIYPEGPQNDPDGPPKGSNRVYRGGGWRTGALVLRSTYRNWFGPRGRYKSFGFRLALSSTESPDMLSRDNS